LQAVKNSEKVHFQNASADARGANHSTFTLSPAHSFVRPTRIGTS
jgi:hypothetical protein